MPDPDFASFAVKMDFFSMNTKKIYQVKLIMMLVW